MHMQKPNSRSVSAPKAVRKLVRLAERFRLPHTNEYSMSVSLWWRRKFSPATVLWVTTALLWSGCGAHRTEEAVQPGRRAEGTKCPAHSRSENPLPGVRRPELTLEYWLQRYSSDQLDAVLMDEEDIRAYNERVGRRQGRHTYSHRDLRVPMDALELSESVSERVGKLGKAATSGQLVARDGRLLAPSDRTAFEQPVTMLAPNLRVLLSPALLRCGPYDGGLYKSNLELAYDRNACGTLKAQEPVELLGQSASGMWLARSRYSLGFLPANTALSPPIGRARQSELLQAPRATVSTDTKVALGDGTAAVWIPGGTRVPLLGQDQIGLATATGLVLAALPPTLTPRPQALTRRALFTEAFSAIGKPYGLGGAEGGIDCSGLLLELFEGFDIALPPFSGWQAQGGSYGVSVEGLATEEKLKRLDLAAQNGVVVLYFPGHTMLYLGRSAAGEPRILHSLGEYLQPCASGEVVVDVQRVVVSGLELGLNTSRKSFLERLTRLVVFGKPPPEPLRAWSDPGPAELPAAVLRGQGCAHSADHHIFFSPAPRPAKPFRVIATSTSDPGGASLRIFTEDGEPLPVDEFELGGPPFTRVARLAKLRAGDYVAVLGSGSKQLACRRFIVSYVTPKSASAPQVQGQGDTIPAVPFWEPRRPWQRDTEALFSAFVEQLFTGPPDDEQTWTNLESLLRDPSRNLLYDHFELGEEQLIEIKPDCADLPFSLRAYFAWKLGHPFAFRRCIRGKTGRPPSCGELNSSLQPRQAADDVAAFSEFVNLAVRPGVNSAAGRTHPDDSDTDLYPVALERGALAPGTVYADPYGHILMVSKWFAQGSLPDTKYGVLMAAEAQPDGTIGRRRFWQGSFLFDPNTTSAGAGFKRFRPLVYDSENAQLKALTNEELRKQREFPRFSREQYRGSRDDFYERMEALINPTPLPPLDRMRSLVDALEETAKRRVLSVDNGEDYVRKNPGQVIPMPQRYQIFETEGPWEDFATPSRDMRLLIAIDTVLALPSRVERSPQHFALSKGESPAAAAQTIRKALHRELQTRYFKYTRSNGVAQRLALADLVSRAKALEVAYNPNDCAEIRWGAPQGSPERATCKRVAPADQQSLMQSYREWFRTRTRPARGE
jgi:cell wall-associated NlpC family hydrolase